MKVHITNLYGLGGTAAKAQHQVADIAKNMLHYNELGIYHYPVESDSSEMLRTRLDGIIASVERGDIVIFQSPTWNSFSFDEAFVRQLNAYSGLKKIFFIHDVPPLMFENGLDNLKRYITFYNHADLIIVPSQNMADFLYANGLTVKKTVIQKMWDFPVSIDKSIYPRFRRRINFAANVSSIYRPFARNWNYKTVQLSVTAGMKECKWASGRNINFLGWFNNDEPLVNALRENGGFGLVWHDDPWWVEYMKLNATYKTGTYLAAGIPLIISKEKAEKDIVISKNLGFAVDSLDEAVERIESTTEEQYNQMVHDVGIFGELIRGGYFTKKLLTDAVFHLLYD